MLPPSPLKAQSVCYLDGGARGVGATGVEDEVPVVEVRLLSVIQVVEFVLAELQCLLDLAH